MYTLSDEEFEDLVVAALDSLPEKFADELDNVAVLVEDEPADWRLEDFADVGTFSPGGELLGLYEGIALTRRGFYYGDGDTVPDTITIFKGPHERLAYSREEIAEQVRRTVVHEVAHFFGMDEDQVAEMGYA